MPKDRPLQWADISSEGRADLSAQVRPLGRARSRISMNREKLETARDRPESNPKTRIKAEQRLTSLDALGPHLVDTDITHQKAANARYNLTMQGAVRSRETGESHNQDWYFQHHKKLRDVAEATGHDTHRVITASAVMSPQNNPEQELAAVSALARMHADPNARITIPKAAMTDAPHGMNDWVGRSVHPSELTSEQLAHVSNAGLRAHMQVTGDVDLDSVAKGGVKGNVTKAINVLRGKVATEDAINPQTSPKVWSYHNNISNAVHGSPEHTEFMARMHQATGNELPGQQRMDLFGLREATHGILNPEGHTAEDTWQQAISTRQKLPAQAVPGRQGRAAMQSPAKFSVGEGGSASEKHLRAVPTLPNVRPPALMHAWQNQATHMAARRLSRESGEIIPATGIQAGGWTEARRQAGKAIEERRTTIKRRGNQQLSLF